MKKISLILTIAIALLLSAFMTGCGADEDEVDDILYESEVEVSVPDESEDDVESLYKELVGTYELVKSEVTYVDQPKEVFEPPQVTGNMTISSDQKITQKYQVLGISVFAKGTFEILPDEGIMLIENELVDLTSKATYTWDGEILTTTLKVSTYVEKDFWRKLNNRVIELQPPEPEPPLPAAAFVSANPLSGSEIAANAVETRAEEAEAAAVQLREELDRLPARLH